MKIRSFLTVAINAFLVMTVAVAAAAAQTPDTQKPFSDHLSGQVIYHGSYHGAVTQTPDHTSIKNGRLNFIIGGGKAIKVDGDIDITLQIDGPNVTLTSQTTGPFSTGAITGTREGANCIFPQTNGTIIAYCGQDGFRGQFKTNKGEAPRIEIDIDTVMTETVDTAEQKK
ncbi:MAG: hypothetical protein QM647_16620 [Asticcacaulis sp.]|uniref:hypothetical protein n=1 Tax=Asticcacaulis sp. TaxID=1872648 RepID=UPI0039E23F6F